VATHVRTIVSGQLPLVVPLCTGVIAPRQLSVAVTLGNGGIWLRQLTPKLPGTPLNCGGVVSATVMICWQLLELPQASTAR
jgi:hypothetical protein